MDISSCLKKFRSLMYGIYDKGEVLEYEPNVSYLVSMS